MVEARPSSANRCLRQGCEEIYLNTSKPMKPSHFGGISTNSLIFRGSRNSPNRFRTMAQSPVKRFTIFPSTSCLHQRQVQAEEEDEKPQRFALNFGILSVSRPPGALDSFWDAAPHMRRSCKPTALWRNLLSKGEGDKSPPIKKTQKKISPLKGTRKSRRQNAPKESRRIVNCRENPIKYLIRSGK